MPRNFKLCVSLIPAVCSIFAGASAQAEERWLCTSTEPVPRTMVFSANAERVRLLQWEPGFEIRPDDPAFAWEILKNDTHGLVAARGDTAPPKWGGSRGPSQVQINVLVLDKGLGELLWTQFTPTDRYLNVGPLREHCTTLK